MELLISTRNALVLWRNGHELVLHSGQGSYYGITWSPKRLYVAARGNNPTRMLAFDSTMWPVEPPPFEYKGNEDDGPHQAFWWNGVLYVANTQRNRVEMWGGGTVQYLHWGRTGRDFDHINSIWRDPDSGDFYIVEHRGQSRPKRIRITGHRFETIEIDLECLADGPTQSGLHNVYVEDETLYTLGPSQIVLVEDGKARTVEPDGVIKHRHYLRGLARSRDFFFIGVSTAMYRDDRGWGASKILVLDGELGPVDEIVLSERYGQVLDFRLLEGDRAHNGIPCPVRF